VEFSIPSSSSSLEHLPVKLLKVASSTEKEKQSCKAALDVGKTVETDTGKKLVERAMQPKAKNKTGNIV